MDVLRGGTMTRKANHLLKRGNVWYLVYMKDGKSYRTSLKTGNYNEARTRAADMMQDVDKGNVEALEAVKVSLQKATGKKLTISRAWEHFVNDPERSDVVASTMDTYRRRFNLFVQWAAGKVENVDDVSLSIARDFIGYITNGKSAKTFNCFKALLSQMWDIFIKAGRATVNPWKEIKSKKVKGHSHTKSELTRDQIKAIFNVASGEMRTLFLIGIFTGMRLKDCILLEWKSIDLNKGFIKVTPFKTETTSGEKVTIPILPPLYDALIIAKKGSTSDYVVPRLAGTYLDKSPCCTHKPINRIFDAAGITRTIETAGLDRVSVDIGFHSLRHTFVTIAYECGIPLATIQAIVGHTNVAMTEHYNHQSPELLANAMSAFSLDVDTDSAQGAAAALPAPDAQEITEMATESKIEALRGIIKDMSKSELKAALNLIRGMIQE